MDADLCSIFGGRADNLCVAWRVLAPVLGVGAGGLPLPPRGTGYYQLENLSILHKKSYIFVHICMILVLEAL